MCGIFAFLSQPKKDKRSIVNSSLAIDHRGPDATHMIHSSFSCSKNKVWYHLVFHRLAINGMTPESGQPLCYPSRGTAEPDIYLMVNGEIYNYLHLKNKYDTREYHSSSDCEIIIHLYRLLGFDAMIRELDGVFSIFLLDIKQKKAYIGRDPFGVRSLWYSTSSNTIAVCSELKGLITVSDVKQFPSGCYASCDLSTKEWEINITRYWNLQETKINDRTLNTPSTYYLGETLRESVNKRMLCDRVRHNGQPAMGCFLSGGLDSSCVAALVQDQIRKLNGGKVVTVSIGFKNSPDLEAAQEVADYIGSEHYSIVVTPEEVLSKIPEVVASLETYDTTTIRAGSMMYVLCQKVAEMFPDIVVWFSGEGADETWMSYLYCRQAPTPEDLEEESRRLLTDLQYFDCLRADKCTAAHGLELRVPHLDRYFVKTALKYPGHMKLCHGIEKWPLRQAVSEMRDSREHLLLPPKIVWRTKEAMSDGVSHETMSWSSIIQHYCSTGQNGLEAEKAWYLEIFLQHYPNSKNVLPYYWQPRWCDEQDPSARNLEVYKKVTQNPRI
jgi:asparagine synthase (glutamine-hydrolysing)